MEKHIDYICDGDDIFDFDSFSIKLIIKRDGTISLNRILPKLVPEKIKKW